jgi:hypothetical protein
MKGHSAMRFRFVLPLPAFVLHPLTAVVVAAVQVYLAAGHLSQLIGGDVQWTHFWKGFGSLGGACVFAALATRGFARYKNQLPSLKAVLSTTNDPQSMAFALTFSQSRRNGRYSQ